MNLKKSIIWLILFSITGFSLIPYSAACLSNATPPVWVNCSSFAGNGLTDVVKTVSASGYAWYFLYIAIYISIAAFLLRQDKSFSRFNAITFMGLIVAIVFWHYNLVGNFITTAAVSLFALSLIASIFFK